MNKFKLNFKIYKYESYWRSSHNKKEYDSFNNILPFPIHSDNEWQNKQLFLEKLIDTNNELLSKHKFNTYDIPKNCLLCDEKNITTGLFKLNLICWEDGLIHYIKKHNTKPSDEFIDYIFRYQIGNRKIIARSKSKKIKGKTIIKENKRYLKINRNQILIMDSLMKQGSVKQFKDNDGMYRYSEQAGLLDFDSNGLERIIISAKTDKIDKYDNEIFLPSASTIFVSSEKQPAALSPSTMYNSDLSVFLLEQSASFPGRPLEPNALFLLIKSFAFDAASLAFAESEAFIAIFLAI